MERVDAASSLVDSLKSLSYGDFVSTVVSGKKEVNTAQEQVMPSFGTNRNVTCYILMRSMSICEPDLTERSAVSVRKGTSLRRTRTRKPRTLAWADRGVTPLAQGRTRAPSSQPGY